MGEVRFNALPGESRVLKAVFGAFVMLALLASTAQAFQMDVIVQNGPTVQVEVEGSDAILSVKQRVMDKTGIPESAQTLVFNGTVLIDNRTLADYNIGSSDTLTVLLPGGTGMGSLSDLAALSQLQSVDATLSGRVAGVFGPMGEPGESGFWIATSFAGLRGDEGGNSGSLLLGYDVETAGGALVGVYAGQDWLDLDLGSKARAPVLGGYFGLPLGEAFLLDGHLGLARPELQIGAARVRSDRVMGALGLSGTVQTEAVILTPSLRLSGYHEDIPAYTEYVALQPAESRRFLSLAAGLRVAGARSLGQTGLRPFAEVSLARSALRTDNDGDQNFAAARAGLGLAGTLGGGTFSAELSGGSLTETVDDLRLSVSYGLQF